MYCPMHCCTGTETRCVVLCTTAQWAETWCVVSHMSPRSHQAVRPAAFTVPFIRLQLGVPLAKGVGAGAGIGLGLVLQWHLWPTRAEQRCSQREEGGGWLDPPSSYGCQPARLRNRSTNVPIVAPTSMQAYQTAIDGR